MGNLLGDFVKGYPWDARYPESVWRGIVEHRAVDAYTASHPSWRKSRDLLPEDLRRFAGIVVDIFYDYFLHRHWDRFSPTMTLTDFVDSVHRDLKWALPVAPPEAAFAIRRMIEQGWLMEYASLDGIGLTLRRVSHRSPVLLPIFDAAEVLEDNLDSMERHFLEFYPDLIGHIEEVRAQMDKRDAL